MELHYYKIKKEDISDFADRFSLDLYILEKRTGGIKYYIAYLGKGLQYFLHETWEWKNYPCISRDKDMPMYKHKTYQKPIVGRGRKPIKALNHLLKCLNSVDEIFMPSEEHPEVYPSLLIARSDLINKIKNLYKMSTGKIWRVKGKTGHESLQSK